MVQIQHQNHSEPKQNSLWASGCRLRVAAPIALGRQVLLALAPRALTPDAAQPRTPRPVVRVFSRVVMPGSTIHVALHVMVRCVAAVRRERPLAVTVMNGVEAVVMRS